MTQIKIFQPETYPKNIVEVRNEIMNFSDDTKNEIIHEEYLRDYASSKLWDLDSEFGKIHNRLMNYMEGYNIVAYHNTRLLNPNKIVNNGLIFSDERYIESLKQDMRQQNISEKLVEDIISKVIRERDRWEHNYKSKDEIKEKLGDPIFNRFDGVIKFEDLSQEAKKMIAAKELKELDEEKIIPENVRKILVEQSTKLENAREIRKLIKDTKSLIEIREICK